MTTLEWQVIGALMDKDAGIEDRTIKAIAERTGLAEDDVRRTLEQLESLEPPLVRRDIDEKLNVEFWIALVRGADALDENT